MAHPANQTDLAGWYSPFRLTCDKSFPMMRRLFDAVVKPTVSYGCEVWGTFCTGDLLPELRQMTDLQLAFFRQVCRLRKEEEEEEIHYVRTASKGL